MLYLLQRRIRSYLRVINSIITTVTLAISSRDRIRYNILLLLLVGRIIIASGTLLTSRRRASCYM